MADAPTSVTSPAAISPEGRRTLVRLIRVAYPHQSFPDGPYERTADAVVGKVDGSVFQALALAHGLASLDAAAADGNARDGNRFVDLDDAAAYALLRQVEGADFFRLIRSVAVVSLYNDQETWSILGYEGSSYEHGGYLHRGFDDLDWLPNPRVEEYQGPEEFIEVAPHDLPATTDGPATSGGAK